MNVSRAELYFLVSAVLILVLCYFFSLGLSAGIGLEMLLVCSATLLYWSASFRAISLMMQGATKLASSVDTDKSRALRKTLLGFVLKGISLTLLIIVMSKLTRDRAYWLAMCTIAYLSLGSFFLILEAVFGNKNK